MGLLPVAFVGDADDTAGGKICWKSTAKNRIDRRIILKMILRETDCKDG